MIGLLSPIGWQGKAAALLLVALTVGVLYHRMTSAMHDAELLREQAIRVTEQKVQAEAERDSAKRALEVEAALRMAADDATEKARAVADAVRADRRALQSAVNAIYQQSETARTWGNSLVPEELRHDPTTVPRP